MQVEKLGDKNFQIGEPDATWSVGNNEIETVQ